MPRMLILLAAPLLMLLAAAIPAQEATPDRTGPVDSRQETSDAGGVADEGRERLALAFVREHHPELAGLLGPLRARAPDQFEAAIGELARARENLDRIRRRDPDRAALALESWKAGSRVELLTARMVARPEARRKAELRQALADQLAAQLALQTYDRDQLRKRLEQLDEAIGKQERRSDALVESRLNAVLKKVQRVRRQARGGGQSAAGAATAPPARPQGDES